MQFTVEKEKLLRVLSIVSNQIPPKPALPILANILIEVEKTSLRMLATNLETGMVFEIEAKNTKPGKTTIPVRTLTEFIAAATGSEVSFKLEDSQTIFTTKASIVKLPVIPADEYPQIPEIGQVLTEVDGNALTATLGRLVFAASADSGRPILTGVLVEFGGKQAKFVATDGYRLSFESLPLVKNLEERLVVIPSKALNQLVKVVSEAEVPKVKILQDASINQIGFEVGKTRTVSRLIDGNFPDWQKIIPESFKTKTTLSKTELLAAIKAASVFAKEAANTVKLIFSKDLEVQTQSSLGSVSTKVAAKITGEKLAIAFNWRFLQEALQAMPADSVEISLVESLSPAKLTPAKSNINFFHIIMPVRI